MEMTLDQFVNKHKELFDLGVCKISKSSHIVEIIIDRFVPGDKPNNGTFLCDAKKLKPAQADARKMGFINDSVGSYVKVIKGHEVDTDKLPKLYTAADVLAKINEYNKTVLSGDIESEGYLDAFANWFEEQD